MSDEDQDDDQLNSSEEYRSDSRDFLDESLEDIQTQNNDNYNGKILEFKHMVKDFI